MVSWCTDLLAGRVGPADPDRPPLTWLGGPLDARGCWASTATRTRSTRTGCGSGAPAGLLHCYEPLAARDVVAALADGSWRVREMAAKVAARWLVGEAADALVPLVGDEVPRVRAAAVRALGEVGEGEHAEAVHDAQDDPEGAVRRAAETALARLRARLDRDV